MRRRPSRRLDADGAQRRARECAAAVQFATEHTPPGPCHQAGRRAFHSSVESAPAPPGAAGRGASWCIGRVCVQSRHATRICPRVAAPSRPPGGHHPRRRGRRGADGRASSPRRRADGRLRGGRTTGRAERTRSQTSDHRGHERRPRPDRTARGDADADGSTGPTARRGRE